jgi:PEP-CTERM motif
MEGISGSSRARRRCLALWAITFGAFGFASQSKGSVISTFVSLNGNSGSNAVLQYAPPTGYSHSAAAPISGNYWNAIRPQSYAASGSGPGTYTLDNGVALVDPNDNALATTLTATYTTAKTSLSKNEPSTGAGDNNAQKPGVMSNAWRDYDNGGGSATTMSAQYYTFALANLAPSTVYDLYIYGGTTTNGQGTLVNLAGANQDGSDPTSLETSNTITETVLVSAVPTVVSGSIFNYSTGSSTYSLVAGGPDTAGGTTTTSDWGLLVAESDGSGNLSFNFGGLGSSAYLNGFQIVDASLVNVPEPASMVAVAAGIALFAVRRRPRGQREC